MIFEEAEFKKIGHGPKTLMTASDYTDNTLASEDTVIVPGSHDSMNCASIQTCLIQQTGRFAESYASDLIMVLSYLQPFLRMENCDYKDERWIIGAGIYEKGVDLNGTIISKISKTRHGPYNFVYPEFVYRKILVIDVQDKEEDAGCFRRTINLKDITHNIYQLDPEDEEDKEEK